MKYLDWDETKNAQLRFEREVCFEDVVMAMIDDRIVDILAHPKQDRYPNQRIYVININQYIYLAPFVENEEKIFLKTIYPSRKMTKKYLIERNQNEIL